MEWLSVQAQGFDSDSVFRTGKFLESVGVYPWRIVHFSSAFLIVSRLDDGMGFEAGLSRV